MITKKHVALYFAAGGLVLLWDLSRVSSTTPKSIWGGFGYDPANGKLGPGALTGAAETVAFWPLAAWHNLTSSS